MDRAASIRRALVVSRSALIAEDLAEILQDFTGAVVDALDSVDEIWGRKYDIAILDAPIERLLGDSRIALLRNAGTKLIVLDDGVTNFAEAGIAVLMQPFRERDVVELLESLGLAKKG